MAKTKIAEAVSEILNEYLPTCGYSLYDLEFVKEGSDRYLRAYIDRTDGEYVGTDDCEKVSNYLSGKLDEDDLIAEAYILEVSSPGLDRKLVKPEHFQRYIGEQVEVSLYKAFDGEKKYTGELVSYEDGDIVIEAEGRKLEFTGDMISKVNLAVII